MSAAMLSAFTSAITTPRTEAIKAAYTVPDALQQFLHRIDERRNANLRVSEELHSLRADLERRWGIASSEGHTSSTMLYQILEYGWKEWHRITA